MNQLNSLIIEGNLCKKPELKSTSNNHKLVVFPIAVNRNYKKNDGTYETEVSYFDIEAWGDLMSKTIMEKGEKGKGVRIVGRLKQNRWKDAEGKNQSKISVIAEHVEFKYQAGEAEKGEGKSKTDKISENTSNQFDKANIFDNLEPDREEEMPVAANGFDIF